MRKQVFTAGIFGAMCTIYRTGRKKIINDPKNPTIHKKADIISQLVAKRRYVIADEMRGRCCGFQFNALKGKAR